MKLKLKEYVYQQLFNLQKQEMFFYNLSNRTQKQNIESCIGFNANVYKWIN